MRQHLTETLPQRRPQTPNDLRIHLTDEDWSTTFNYTYDAAGNILSKDLWNDYNGSEGSLTYTYGNESWPDLLTAVNGQKIAYEGQTYSSAANTVSGTVISGNPISYFNGNTRWNFTWENGRQRTPPLLWS